MPAFVADMPGRAQAGIFFRVGWADETLATHGLTHLVEHLVAGGFTPRAGVSAAVRPCVTPEPPPSSDGPSRVVASPGGGAFRPPPPSLPTSGGIFP
jgi:hypothetical protein